MTRTYFKNYSKVGKVKIKKENNEFGGKTIVIYTYNIAGNYIGLKQYFIFSDKVCYAYGTNANSEPVNTRFIMA